jgi:ribonucleoside-diphosphate reductase alpha chain
MDNDRLEVNPYFEAVARAQGFYSEELMDARLRKAAPSKISRKFPKIRKVFVTAHDVSPEWHIRMQAAFQKYTDNAVSKTVNMPRDATVEDVFENLRPGLRSDVQGRHHLQ